MTPRVPASQNCIWLSPFQRTPPSAVHNCVFWQIPERHPLRVSPGTAHPRELPPRAAGGRLAAASEYEVTLVIGNHTQTPENAQCCLSPWQRVSKENLSLEPLRFHCLKCLCPSRTPPPHPVTLLQTLEEGEQVNCRSVTSFCF